MSETTDPFPREDVLALLGAIRDSVDVPMAALDPANERAWHALMQRRLGSLCDLLTVALDPTWVDVLDPTREAADIRSRLAKMPVTYALFLPATPGALAEQRHQVLDPAVPPLAAAGPDADFAASVAAGYVDLPDWADAAEPVRETVTVPLVGDVL